MNTEDPIVIAGAKRTPMGGFQGELSPAKATELGACAIAAALTDAGVPAQDVEEVFMGCVLPAGLGQAPARQASLAAGIPLAAGCTTINQRQRDVSTETTAIASIIAQPKCSDGIAAIWLAAPSSAFRG